MWKRSFVATTVALGDSVDDALAAIAEPIGARDGTALGRSVSHAASASRASSAFAHVAFASHAAAAQPGPSHLSAAQLPANDPAELVAQLRAPQRATRAAALAKAVHEIVLRIDEVTLR